MCCILQIYFYNLGKLNAGNTNIPIIYDGLHMTDCLLSVKILNRLSSGTCTIFHINISSGTNAILDTL